jgi:hypothetical protein
MVVVPVRVLAAVRMSVPSPDRVSPPVPVMRESMVRKSVSWLTRTTSA